ncbi:MAG: ABC transporter substrate-binding protein, partial [Bacteroidota bacterium]
LFLKLKYQVLMEKIRLALDWTPNVNHIGFFVAKDKGFYQDQGVELSIKSPADDNYGVTPAKKVELGEADFALCPMESIVSYRTKTNAFPLKAVATVFQEDISAIATLKRSDISSPKDLDGKTYASYKARYEDEIVKQMILNDGGNGDIEISYPEKLGIWETLLKGNADATWIFLNWEGVEAKMRGIDLSLFKMRDYDVPYSYSPVIAVNEVTIEHRFNAFKRFISAKKKGFLHAMDNPMEESSILKPEVSKQDENIDLKQTIVFSSSYMGNIESWGMMDEYNVSGYIDWLKVKGLETRVISKELFTNSLLDS